MRRFRWGFVGFGLVLAIEGLGTGAASAANQAVSIFDFGFTPTPLSSTVGGTVTWTNSTAGTPCFGAATGFANTPACQTTTVNPAAETDVTGMYS